jgi:hypothetical protein
MLGGLATLGLGQGAEALTGEGPADGRDADLEAGGDLGGGEFGVEGIEEGGADDGGTRAAADHPGGLQAAVHGGRRAGEPGRDVRARPALVVERHHVVGAGRRRRACGATPPNTSGVEPTAHGLGAHREALGELAQTEPALQVQRSRG